MQIDALTPGDAEAYVALRREMLADTPHAFGADPSSDRGSDPALVRASLASEGYAIFAAREQGGLIAAAGVRREPTPKTRHIAMIWGVYVQPAHRRRGVARGVLRALLDHASAWPGLVSFRLSVSAASPHARALYESLGFRAYGQDPAALFVGGVYYDEVMMYRPVGPIG